MKMRLTRFRQSIAVLTTATFLFSTLSAPLVEAGFWEDRRAARSAQAQGDEPLLLAQLPAVAAVQDIISQPSELTLAGLSDIAHIPYKASALPAGLSRLPSAAGEVREFHSAGAEAPVVVLIQDAHGIESAQKSIARILEHVQSALPQGRELLVGLEGATGGYRHEEYRALSRASARREAAEFLLNRSLINGAEFHALTAERAPLLWGLEDESLYLKNVEAYRKGASLSGAAASAAMRSALDEAKRRTFSPAMAGVDALFQAYHEGRLDARGLLEGLNAGHGLTPRAGSNLERFAAAVRAEKALDFAAVEAERLEVVRALTEKLGAAELRDLVARTLSFRLGELDAAAYYGGVRALLGRNGIDLEKRHPAFAAYIAYLGMVERIEAGALPEEIQALEDLAAERFAASPREAETARLARDWRLADKMARHELSFAEWKVYQTRRAAARRLPEALGVEAAAWTRSLEASEEFYATAEARNRALVAGLAGKMPSARGAVAAMIAGGFHTDGLRRELEGKGYSYAVVTPRLDATRGATEYLDVFAVDRTPVEKMLLGEKLLLAPANALVQQAYPGFEHVGAVAGQVFDQVYVSLSAREGDPAEAAREVGADVSVKAVDGSLVAAVDGLVTVVSDASDEASHDAAVRQVSGQGVRLDGQTSKSRVTIVRRPRFLDGWRLDKKPFGGVLKAVSRTVRLIAILAGLTMFQAVLTACEPEGVLEPRRPPIEHPILRNGQAAPAFIHDGHAYVVSGSYSHWVVSSGSEISVVDLNTWKVVGTYTPSVRPTSDYANDGQIRHLSFAGDALYLTTGVGLFVVDVSDPRRPVETGRVDAAANESFRGVRVANGRAYVIAVQESMSQPNGQSLRVYDLSGASPVLLGEKAMANPADGPTGANGLEALPDGKHVVYAADGGFEVWNVEDPAQMRLVYRSRGGSGHLTLAGGLLFNAAYDLEVWNLSVPQDPRLLSGTPAEGALGRFGDAVRRGTELTYYDATSDGRLTVFGVRPDGQTTRQGFLNFRPENAGNYHVVGLDVSGDTAYVRVAEYWSTGFVVYSIVRVDVSDPAAPRFIDSTMIFPMVDETAGGGRRSSPIRVLPDTGRGLTFEVPRAGRVYVALFDAAGRQVRVLQRFGEARAGRNRVEWDGRDDAGRALPSGGYEARIIYVGDGEGGPAVRTEPLTLASGPADTGSSEAARDQSGPLTRFAAVLGAEIVTSAAARAVIAVAGLLLASAGDAWAAAPGAPEAVVAGAGLGTVIVPVLVVIAGLLLFGAARRLFAQGVGSISAALKRPQVSGTGGTGRDLSVPGSSSGSGAGDGNGPSPDDRLFPAVQRGLLAAVGMSARARLTAERLDENMSFLNALALYAGASGDGTLSKEDVGEFLSALESSSVKHAEGAEAEQRAARWAALVAAASETARQTAEQGAERLAHNGSRLAAALGALRREFPDTAGALVLLASRDFQSLLSRASDGRSDAETTRRAFMGQVSWGASVPLHDGDLNGANIHAADLRRGMWEKPDYLEHVARSAAQGGEAAGRGSWLLTDIEPGALKAAFEAAGRRSGSAAIADLLARWDGSVAVARESDLRASGVVTPSGVVQLKKWILQATGAKDVSFGVAVTTADASLWDVTGLREELVQFLLWITSSVVFKAGPAQIEEYLKAQKVLDIQA